MSRSKAAKRIRLKRVGLLTILILAAASAAPALAVVIEHGRLRISISAQLKPYRLPRAGRAPIDVFIAGHVASVDGSTPPQLRRMDVKLNRHGLIDGRGLPSCHLGEIATASNDQALSRCKQALVGSGHFWASVVLPDQPSYRTTGRLLVFNGVHAGRQALFAHIYTAAPFPSSFVVTFSIRHIDQGPYGTELSASLPQALGDWGVVNRIKMTLGRTYRQHGRQRGYVEAGCPAPPGTKVALFPLARLSFHFAGQNLRSTITRSCGVRE
jgi:hypothetical protein